MFSLSISSTSKTKNNGHKSRKFSFDLISSFDLLDKLKFLLGLDTTASVNAFYGIFIFLALLSS